MTKKDSTYVWDPCGPPPPIEDHSLAKHDVLDQYLRRYVEVVTVNVARDNLKITLIDGFSGGGKYTNSSGELHLGSPLRMIHAMSDAEIVANERRNKDFTLDAAFLFLEEDGRTLDYLRNAVREDPLGHHYLGQGKVEFILGSFHEQYEKITNFVAGRGQDPRAIFLLDQYGYTDVPLPQINTILTRFPKAEVMLTFATDWLLDYLSDKQQTRNLLARMNLRHLERDFDTLFDQKQRKTREWRRAAQSLLYKDLYEGSGARFFTPFFIRSAQAHRDYWFVHLSGHERARDEMTKLHWGIQNRFAHYGRAGFSMLGYDPDEDPLLTGQPLFGFGETDKEESKNRLMLEIPKKIEEIGKNGISFAEFFRRVCNDTPSTESYLKEVIRELSLEGDIAVLSDEGKKRLPGVKVNGTDIIRLPEQTILFGWPTKKSR
jgi:three-Cys-motif partner protein